MSSFFFFATVVLLIYFYSPRDYNFSHAVIHVEHLWISTSVCPFLCWRCFLEQWSADNWEITSLEHSKIKACVTTEYEIGFLISMRRTFNIYWIAASNMRQICIPVPPTTNSWNRLFHPMRTPVFTNKRGDWMKPVEGGIFQYKSLRYPRSKYAKKLN